MNAWGLERPAQEVGYGNNCHAFRQRLSRHSLSLSPVHRCLDDVVRVSMKARDGMPGSEVFDHRHPRRMASRASQGDHPGAIPFPEVLGSLKAG